MHSKQSYLQHLKDEIKEASVSESLSSSKNIDAFIIGCGTVGGALINQINEQQTSLLQDHQIDLKIYGIANQKTFMTHRSGVDLDQWEASLIDSVQQCKLTDLKEFVKVHGLSNPVIVDCTGSREVALRYDDFFANGMHVITANKIANGEPIDFYNQIRETARLNNRRFQYETNIGAGLPIIEPLQKLIKAGDQLNKFEGILSGSLSYIFGQLHNGLSLSQATLKAKNLGYTEPDPREVRLVCKSTSQI